MTVSEAVSADVGVLATDLESGSEHTDPEGFAGAASGAEPWGAGPVCGIAHKTGLK